jgi:DNA primase
MNDTQTPDTIVVIKARHPLPDVVARYVPELKRSGGWLVGRCPFHGHDRNPSFAVSLATDTWQCFAASCDLGGDVIDFVGVTRFGRAWNARNKEMFKAALADLEGGLPALARAVPKDWHNPMVWRPVELSPEVQITLHAAARIYHTTLLTMGDVPGSPLHYLVHERGFTPQTMRREGIGYAVGDLLGPALAALGLGRRAAVDVNLVDEATQRKEFMAGRIVFLEMDRSGRVLHMIGRKFAPWMGEGAQKYLALKEFSKPLYGYARLDKRPSDRPVVLVESPPDQITAEQWGWDAMAVTGTRLKEDLARVLAHLERPLAIVPHNDAENQGWHAAERWKAQIGHGDLAQLPDGVKDLNELGVGADGESWFRRLMKQRGFEFKPRSREPDGPPRPIVTQGDLWAESLLSSHF